MLICVHYSFPIFNWVCFSLAFSIRTILTISGFTNNPYPLTCCDDLFEHIDVDEIKNQMSQQDWDGLINDQKKFFSTCKKNPNDDGSYPILKKFITILFVAVLLFLLVLVLFLTLLVCAACSVIKQGPKQDKWSDKYNGGGGGK